MERKIQVVIIGKNDASQEDKEIAYQTGKIIASSGAVLITGGKFGVMKHSSRGAQDENGLVISIIPDTKFEGANKFSDVIIPTGIGYARNMINVLAADLVIAIGGGAGTLSEIAYAWQFNKTIFAYSCVMGWSAIVADMKRIDEKHRKKIISIESISDFQREYFAWLDDPTQFA